MDLSGKNLIGRTLSAKGSVTFSGVNPVTAEALSPAFHEATDDEVNAALELADTAAGKMRSLPAEKIALFLEAIAEEIVAAGEELIKRAQVETALPQARLEGEQGR